MDDALLFVVRCPSGGATLVVVEDPHMLGAKDRLIRCEVLVVEDSNKLISAAAVEWHPIP